MPRLPPVVVEVVVKVVASSQRGTFAHEARRGAVSRGRGVCGGVRRKGGWDAGCVAAVTGSDNQKESCILR